MRDRTRARSGTTAWCDAFMSRVGVRSDWSAVPESVRAAVDVMVASPVVSTSPVVGGFSPGPAVRAVLADGRSVFLKAAGLALNPLSPEMHRREADIVRLLPPTVPAPRLIGVVDDGDWVALVTEWIDGHNPDASSHHDVDRLLAQVDLVASHEAPLGLATFADTHPGVLSNWTAAASCPPAGLDSWSRSHLEVLAELDQRAPAATTGVRLVHADLRNDNVVLAAVGPRGDRVVDWTAACAGAPWLDLVGLLPALHLDGGPPPAAVFDDHPLARQADPGAVDAFVAALAGYFTCQALRPPPPGLPTVRAFQAAQGAIARRWLAERLDLPALPS